MEGAASFAGVDPSPFTTGADKRTSPAAGFFGSGAGAGEMAGTFAAVAAGCSIGFLRSGLVAGISAFRDALLAAGALETLATGAG